MASEEKTLGEICAEARERTRISLEKAAEVLRVPGRVLAAFESGEYEKLPPDAFLRGMVAKYADFLGLDRTDCIAFYERERGFAPARARSGSRDLLPQNRFSPKPVWWAFGAKELAGAVATAAFVYLFWQFGGFLRPPAITLESPADDFTVTQASVFTVSGSVRGTDRLIVNGERLSGGKDGRFKAAVELEEGENVIEVSAEDARGRSASVVRKVLYQPPQEVAGP